MGDAEPKQGRGGEPADGAGAGGDADEELSPAELARARRRDRDAEAHERAGMNTGLAKQFKQVLDAQGRRARESDGGGAGKRPKR